MRDVQTREEIYLRLLKVAFNSVRDEDDFLSIFGWSLVNENASLKANKQVEIAKTVLIFMSFVQSRMCYLVEYSKCVHRSDGEKPIAYLSPIAYRLSPIFIEI